MKNDNENLFNLLFSGNLSQYGKRLIVNRFKELEKENDKLKIINKELEDENNFLKDVLKSFIGV